MINITGFLKSFIILWDSLWIADRVINYVTLIIRELMDYFYVLDEGHGGQEL